MEKPTVSELAKSVTDSKKYSNVGRQHLKLQISYNYQLYNVNCFSKKCNKISGSLLHFFIPTFYIVYKLAYRNLMSLYRQNNDVMNYCVQSAFAEYGASRGAVWNVSSCL